MTSLGETDVRGRAIRRDVSGDSPRVETDTGQKFPTLHIARPHHHRHIIFPLGHSKEAALVAAKALAVGPRQLSRSGTP